VQGHDHIYIVVECKRKGALDYTIVWYFIWEGAAEYLFTCETIEKAITSNNP